MVRLIADAKRAIARQVAALFEEDDTRLFDNRRTVSHLAEFLKDQRNFTAIVNGLKIARRLTQNPSNTVIWLLSLRTARWPRWWTRCGGIAW